MTKAKKDYAKMGDVTFSIRFEDSYDVRGVEEGHLRTNGRTESTSLVIGSGAPVVIRVRGISYLAASVAASITCDVASSFAVPGAVKFGPGGRRIYTPITEGLIDELLKVNGYYGEGDRNAREARISFERTRFIEALLELL